MSKCVLFPLSLIYGVGVAVRNFMFNKGFLKQETFDVPVVVVGNLTVGGAGKTPHTEYILEHLCEKYKIGMLSRGYRRKTKGFVMASINSRPEDIGDEPLQIYRKFRSRGVVVAVCENRVKGINMMLEMNPELNMIVLDDAYQHRYVKPTVSVLLTEQNRPAYKDSLLPMGRLREPFSSMNRADIVVVTKCSQELKPVDYRLIRENLDLFPYQRLLFSRYKYLPLVPLFPDSIGDKPVPKIELLRPTNTMLAVAGVANPRPFIKYLRRFQARVKLMLFDDHHNFSHSDMVAMQRKFESFKSKDKLMITTEKDAVRLAANPYFPPSMRNCSYYVPIAVEFVSPGGEKLDEMIEVCLKEKSSSRGGES